MERELFFCLKKNINLKKRDFSLSDFCDVHGASQTVNLSDYTYNITSPVMTISAFEVSKKLKMIYPDFSINNIGPDECSIFYSKKSQSKMLLFIKTFVLSLIMFFGGAITIMTFHEDTNMRSVHSSIYMFFTGEQKIQVPIVSVPYSIGIAIGFAVLYGLFKKKSDQPSLLDLNIGKHEDEIKKYMSQRRGKDDG